MTARSIAAAALAEWRRQERFADAIIHEQLQDARLAQSDRAFARELFYGVLRNLRLLDFWIGLLRQGTLDETSRGILQLGLYQLFILRTASHAAVNETVALATKKNRSLINAVLRSAQRRTNELHENAEAQSLSIRFSHPDFLIARWSKTFGEEKAAAMAALNNRPAPVYGRVNRLKIAPEEFFAGHPQYKPIPDRPDFFEADHLPSDALAAGLVYVQDPSTTVACEMLDPQPNEHVLDACAAPGGKTSLLAQQMKNRGVILACDRDDERLHTLQQNLDRLRVTIATVAKIDWIKTSDEKPKDRFDRILLDAPCSNTGVMRRRVDVRWRLQPNDFARMQKRQLAIARNVLGSLKPGGVFVYSTCSLEPEENEDVVAQLLNELKDLQLLEQRVVTPFAHGFDGAFAAKLKRIR